MKKLILLGAVAFGMFFSADANAQCGTGSCGAQPSCAPVSAQQSCAPADQPTNNCWCQYVHYEPNYYCTPRCVAEQVPYTEKACRYNTKYYDVQRCRYVPEYYTETYSYQEPEYYDVCKSKTVYRTEYDTHVEYKPSYYWKNECGNSCAPTPSCGCSR
jgi:hypothetical protein